MKEPKNKVIDIDDMLIDFNLDMNELAKRTFGKSPIFDVNEPIEETMERFFEDLSRRSKQARIVKK